MLCHRRLRQRFVQQLRPLRGGLQRRHQRAHLTLDLRMAELCDAELDAARGVHVAREPRRHLQLVARRGPRQRRPRRSGWHELDHVGVHRVVVQRPLGAVADRPQRVDHEPDAEGAVAEHALEQHLARRDGAGGERLAVVAHDAQARGLLAQRLAVVLADPGHRPDVVRGRGAERQQQGQRPIQRDAGHQRDHRRDEHHDQDDAPDDQAVQQRRAHSRTPTGTLRPLRLRRHRKPTVRDE